jgi:hypothetical protein
MRDADGLYAINTQPALYRFRLIVNMPCQQRSSPYTGLVLSCHIAKTLSLQSPPLLAFAAILSITERPTSTWCEPLLAFSLRQFLFNFNRCRNNHANRGERTLERWRKAPEPPALGLAGYQPCYYSHVSLISVMLVRRYA